ncbi:hypothetical protein FOXB_09871 [Fusarium oxysporum f. sp. conglutinans Fo5176]|uniref:Uncharacterized protein n=1 Tax=Fusarium oxysporum (strain Fo5176) TaxID=660025 RepID=F9FTZ0_FUSOF|nr:hypothetical protein FOXB_09871 [Fusarium oxysporum f. sp. conglutinans Fo5176]
MLPTFSLVQDNLRASMEALELLRQNADYVSSKLEVKTGLKRKLAAVKIAIGKESSDRLITRLNELGVSIDEGQLPRKPKDDAKLNKKYTASRFGRFVMAYATTTGAWQAYLQLPSWLSSSVYELQSTPTGYGWTYNYRVYNLVSSKSDIIQKIKQGDRDGTLELFGTRKASPFDKDEYGQSLLYHAAKSKNLDICQLLLSLGLREALVEKPGPYGESPLAPPVLVPSRSHPEKTWLKIAGLFQSYMDEPETSMVLRMFEYHKTCDYGDEYVRIFRQRFLPNYYHGPLIHRLEAFRLGSFHCQDFTTLKVLLAEDRKFTSFDVTVAFSIRFADEVLPFKRDWIMWYLSPFGDHWSHMVQGVASVATAKDLHTVEKIQPWDVYQVPCWRGTPLISVIGGALCYLSPDISFVHWDNVFQECIQKWASLLQLSGVDLMLYGEQEAANLNKYFRSSFDMSAIEASRNEIRNVMPRGSARMTFRRAERADRERWNKNHWVPIRLLKLKFGQTPGEWQISWAPEFECMANEFWQMVDKGETTMPGSWVDG